MSPDDVVLTVVVAPGALAVLLWAVCGVRAYRSWRGKRWRA